VSALARLEKLPDWPARMTADVAAIYMGIAKTTFLSRFGTTGVKEGSNTLWARMQLDRIIAKQFAIAQSVPSGEGDSSWDDLR
jgi:hypothetical protein